MPVDELVKALIALEVRHRMTVRGNPPMRYALLDGLVDDYLTDGAVVPTSRAEIHTAARGVLNRIDAKD